MNNWYNGNPKGITVHQLGRHSFAALVDILLEGRMRVTGSTAGLTLNRAKYLRKNYWTMKTK